VVYLLLTLERAKTCIFLTTETRNHRGRKEREREKKYKQREVFSLPLPLWFLPSVVYLLLTLERAKTCIFLNHRDKKPQRKKREKEKKSINKEKYFLSLFLCGFFPLWFIFC